MTCEICGSLVITDGNPNIYPYMCREVERQILAPWKEQEWCPKKVGRKKSSPQKVCVQTTDKELLFMNSLPFHKLAGYLKGVEQRVPETTGFNINVIITATKERMEEGE